MPIPTPKKRESKNDFISRCMGDNVMVKDFEDQKQRAAVCYQKWKAKEAKASFVMNVGDDTFIYTYARMVLPANLVEKMKMMPESGAGYHRVKAMFKNGKMMSGIVHNCEEFEMESDSSEMENEEIVEIEMEDVVDHENEHEQDEEMHEESEESEEKVMSNIFAAVEYSDKALYEKVKKDADNKFDKNSYVKNLWVLKEYKKRGGSVKYSGSKPSGKSIKKQVTSSINAEMLNASPEEKTELSDFIYSLSNKDFTEDYFVQAAANEGKKLNKPFRLPKGSNKKFGVYVKNDKGNTVVVKFGDPKLEIKRDNPERRSNFRARHGCDNPGPKWKAKYWSCKMWSKKPVSQIASALEIDWENLPEMQIDSGVEIVEEDGI